MSAPRRVALVCNRERPVPSELVATIVEACRARGIETLLASPPEPHPDHLQMTNLVELIARADLVITAGGDGTLLSAAPLLVGTDKTLWGIHVGRLGYLTDITPDELDAALPVVLDGAARIENLEFIAATLQRPAGEPMSAFALNEIAVESAGSGRMISLDVTVQSERMAVIEGNGIIVSTPAGSTAYNLAAGGPILLPGADALVINPICPHTLTYRPVIVSNRSEIVIQPLSDRGAPRLLADGRVIGETLGPDSRIVIRGSGRHLRMLKTSRRSGFDILREKLGWGNPRGESR